MTRSRSLLAVNVGAALEHGAWGSRQREALERGALERVLKRGAMKRRVEERRSRKLGGLATTAKTWYRRLGHISEAHARPKSFDLGPVGGFTVAEVVTRH